jgi:hypothetical protein
VVTATQDLLGNIPVIGDLIDGAKDVQALMDDLQDGSKLDQVLDGVQLAIDVAKITQIGKLFTGPLEMAIGILQSGVDAVEDFNKMKGAFGQIMLTGQDDTPRIEIDSDEAKLIVELSHYGVAPDAALAIAQQYPDVRPASMRNLVELAQAMGVPPDQLGPFLEQLAQEACDTLGHDDASDALNDVSVLATMPDGPITRAHQEWDVRGVSGMTQDYFNDLFPQTAGWVTSQFGAQAQEDALIREAYLSLYGVPPTEDQLAQWRGQAHEDRTEKSSAMEAYYALRDQMKDTDEYRASHPQ